MFKTINWQGNVGEGEDGGEKVTEVHLPVTDGAEDSGRRQIIVVMVIASAVKGRPEVLSPRLCMRRGVANLKLTILNTFSIKLIQY